MIRNLKATVQYDGTGYFGFQSQANEALPTIQAVIEKAILNLFNEEIRINSAGRTDRGVHAFGQVFNFYTDSCIPVERMAYALNQQLPKDIVITKIEEVDQYFHARKSALGKYYQYKIYNCRTPMALGNQYFYWVPYGLNEALINQACGILEGTHNFKSFCSAGSSVRTYERTIYYIRVNRQGNWWDFNFYGSGFLYNMIRIMIGTLLDIGSGRRELSNLYGMLEGENRCLAGKTAPACGLYLKSVYYP